MKDSPNPLPYTDTKPVGAADFYFGINATFRFIHDKLGRQGWQNYLAHLGREYFRPVNTAWRNGGFPAIADYWRAFFAAEPGADVVVHAHPDEVEIEVRVCPAIKRLREGGREIVPYYCNHCFVLGSVRAEEAGYSMRLEGGNGSCRHRYRRSGELPPQDPAAIKEVPSC